MSVQTSYAQSPNRSRAGMISQSKGNNNRIISKAAAGAIPAGRFVARSADDKKCKLPAATGDVTATGFGFAVWDPAREPRTAVSPFTANEFVQYDDVPILEQGYIDVYTETTVVFGEAVCVRFTTGTPADGSDLGQVRSGTDSGKAVALPGARFDEGRTGAGLVRIKVGMTTTPAASGATGATGATGPTGPTGPTGS